MNPPTLRTTLRTLDINPLNYLEKLESFDGKKENLHTFCTDVDDILPTLMQYNEQAQKMCINIVKRKLVGNARRAMEIHPHLSSWNDIKAMLQANFGGFATADQLYEQLRASSYRGNTLDFYNHIQKQLAMLNQKSSQEDRSEDVVRNTQTALNIFITRLPQNMRTILCALKVSTMEEAIHELSSNGFLNDERKTFNKQPNHQNNRQQQNWQPKQYTPNPQRVKQLFTILDFPIIVTLIYRNDKPFFCAIHICDQLNFRTFHVILLNCLQLFINSYGFKSAFT